MANRKDLDGQVMRNQTGVATWLIDQGQRRLIPDELTFNNLFTGWDVIVKDDDVVNIDEGQPLSSGAALLRGNGVATWLVTNGEKRSIDSEAIFNRYHFAWNKIQYVPQILLDAIKVGEPVGP